MIGTPFPGFEVVPKAAKAALIVVHGIAEHADRYRHVAEALAAEGIACFVYDQRGHGNFPARAPMSGISQNSPAICNWWARPHAKIPLAAAVRMGPQHGLGRGDARGH